MNIIPIIAACVFVFAFICPTEMGSILSLILAHTCLPLRSVPLAACILFLLTIGFFQGWYFALFLCLSMLLNLLISISIGREVASYA